jgi:exopolyphosphatase / guanosine-5'-triphosphate,3'-diphosphate pyrophosphatase
MQKIASIDLGTNTCNLIIAELKNNNFTTIVSERRVIKLLSEKTESGHISDEAIERCVNAFLDYRKIIDNHNADTIIALATSGLRNATNRDFIIDEIYKTSQIRPQIINGEKEAQLIYKGAYNAFNCNGENNLLLDIGGGSNEFIAFNKTGMLFAYSFEIGIARVLNMHKYADPLSVSDIQIVENLFKQKLTPLIEKSHQYNFSTLIGSSGTFETLSSIYKNNYNDELKQSGIIISIDDFNIISNNILKSTFKEREQIPGMDLMRVEMMPIAILLVQFVLKTFKIKQIIYSKYSLKEGAIIDILTEKNN